MRYRITVSECSGKYEAEVHENGLGEDVAGVLISGFPFSKKSDAMKSLVFTLETLLDTAKTAVHEIEFHESLRTGE